MRELSAAGLPIGQVVSIWAPIGQSMIFCLTWFPGTVSVVLKLNKYMDLQNLHETFLKVGTNIFGPYVLAIFSSLKLVFNFVCCTRSL